MICVRGSSSVSSSTRRDIRKTSLCGGLTDLYLCLHPLKVTYFCASSEYFELLISSSWLLPAPLLERDLKISPRPQGSRLDWISNQCYTSCLPASAIFNAETVPRGRDQLSAGVCGQYYHKNAAKEPWLEEEFWIIRYLRRCEAAECEFNQNLTRLSVILVLHDG